MTFIICSNYLYIGGRYNFHAALYIITVILYIMRYENATIVEITKVTSIFNKAGFHISYRFGMMNKV